jgi:ATP-dependent RNA helicase DHX29
MDEHPQPEMLRLSLQDLALRIKIMKFSGSIEDVLLRALDAPQAVNIQRAISALIEVSLPLVALKGAGVDSPPG